MIPFNYQVVVRGELSLGTYKDEEFGFVSKVRVITASFERA